MKNIGFFDISYFSDSNYEELTVEISFKEQLLCQLNKDKGTSAIEIEFFADMRLLPTNVAMKFSLDSFMEVLQESRKSLVES